MQLQGITEDPNKFLAKNFVPIHEELIELLHLIEERTKNKELKKLGKAGSEQSKPRTLLLMVSSEHEARRVVAKLILIEIGP